MRESLTNRRLCVPVLFMSEPIEIERDEEMLGELAELDLALAKAVFARAVAAEDAAELDGHGRTYQRLARSLRQTIALRDRLRRQRRQEARDNPPPRDEARIVRRKAELRDAMRRVIWNETEGEEQDFLWELVDDNLDCKHQPDDWGLQPLDDHVVQFCAAFNLPPEAAARWRDLPEVVYAEDDDGEDTEDGDAEAPPPEPEPADAERRSTG